jgi:small nuclear ribonucleoprotein (snRNP)-like protein
MPYNVTVDRIIDIDLDNNFLYTGDLNDMLKQMRFVITDSTVILDKYDNRIQLEDLGPGQMVRIEHAIFQTASIPPQTTAFLIQVL